MGLLQAQSKEIKEKPKVDTRIDNMRYWNDMIKKGYAKGNPVIKIEPAIYRGSTIDAKSVKTEDSPDVPVSAIEQTEVSVFVSPTDNNFVMNSNNSGNSSAFYGANFFYSANAGQTWGGQYQGAGGSNSGDPAILMALNARKYVGYIHNNYGQGVSFTDNDGANWTNVLAAPNPGSMLDKNHLWIDNSPSSPYVGYVYDAWTDFGGTYDSEIGFVRTTNGGTSYGSKIILSQAVNAGNHNQGVNIQTGPNGEVYAVWSIYDSWPSDETALGFAKSLDGGAAFAPSSRILTNIKGIRTTEVLKNHRVNSFPSMAVDISGGIYNGTIYIVWTNIGVPGINTGTNKSIYITKSTDEGDTWSTPIRVNQGPNTNGKEAYFPWITCDPETGILSVIFYDDRNVSSTQVETWVANSYDGGETWEDFRVSDVAFTPSPLAGMADGYMGDYLGIAARGGMVYPMWPDNRTGDLLTYVSPFETNNRVKPTNLQIVLTEGTGQVDLSWSYTEAKTLQYFVVYRDNVQIGTTSEMSFVNTLPDFGIYSYSVTAMHDDGESSPARGNIQWGDPDISVSPSSITESLFANQMSTKILTVNNTGELDLIYNIATAITSKENEPKAYCNASGQTLDEYISNVTFGSINNSSGWTGYSDYTAQSTDISVGDSYPITIAIGTPYSGDQGAVWIDWNQDEDFEDAGENIPLTVNSGVGPYTGNIVPPMGALPGSTRMRVRITYSQTPEPCGETNYGEAEDYTVNVNSWLFVEPLSGTISPGSSQNININFNSEDFAVGEYAATMSINSDDLDIPVLDIPITLTVMEDITLQIFPTADDYDVCIGSSTILHANAQGGTGSYTYNWTSVPEGFTSIDANPEVFPTENTIYILAANDGTETEISQVTINALELPNLNLPPFTDVDESAAPFTLTGGLPVGGTYSGTGVSEGMFYPGVAGMGTHTITYTYTDGNACENAIQQTITVDDINGVNIINAGIKIDMYPNPNNGILYLDINSFEANDLTVTVLNEVGISVFNSKIHVDKKSLNQIDLSQLASGIYFISIKGEMIQVMNKIALQK